MAAILNYYETETTCAPYNLAMEEALAEEVGKTESGCFMLWQNSPSVIIGRHQNALSEVNLPELKRRDITLVRRMTGGGAVYHDLGNLNFTFLLPQAERQDISHLELLTPLLDYLKSLGVPAGMEGRNDISVTGAGKFSGLASRQMPGRFQLHGTIMYDVDLSVLGEVLLVDPAKFKSKGVASVRARVTNLKPFLPITLGEFWAGFRDACNIAPGRIPMAVQDKASALAETKYSRDDWNVGQSPQADIFLKNRFPFGSLELHLAAKKNLITQVKITGDFLTPSNTDDQIPIEKLEQSLISLPADHPRQWAEAWSRFDLTKVFYGQILQTDVTGWLADSI
ncbi:lipoate--protein ligase [Deltaproteobacteria bacterium Smac51]|nr:lipoate--protein ligase [Deltaproteobacteria bacterium Smac51]